MISLLKYSDARTIKKKLNEEKSLRKLNLTTMILLIYNIFLWETFYKNTI